MKYKVYPADTRFDHPKNFVLMDRTETLVALAAESMDAEAAQVTLDGLRHGEAFTYGGLWVEA